MSESDEITTQSEYNEETPSFIPDAETKKGVSVLTVNYILIFVFIPAAVILLLIKARTYRDNPFLKAHVWWQLKTLFYSFGMASLCAIALDFLQDSIQPLANIVAMVFILIPCWFLYRVIKGVSRLSRHKMV